MATARTAVVHDWESEYRGIERWYRDELAKTPPPTGLQWQPISVGPTWKHDGNGWLLPETTLGWRFLAWCGVWLRDREGRDWQFTMEQARFWLWYYALDEFGRWCYASAVLQRLKGWGKDPMLAACSAATCFGPTMFDRWAGDTPIGTEDPAAWVQLIAVSQQQPLALETPVRTGDGWSTIGRLRVGDTVYDSGGRLAPIVRQTEVFHDRDCYRVTFDDGESIVATSEHGWTFEVCTRHGDRMVEETHTTAEWFAIHRERGRRARLRTPLVPMQGEDANLQVDPYLLGLWLGNGMSADAAIAIDSRVEVEMIGLIGDSIEPWEQLAVDRHKGNSGTIRVKRLDGICPRGHEYFDDQNNQMITSQGHRACRRCNSGARAGRSDAYLPTLRERLRSVGVLGDKHIPAEYLWASYEQRMELLRGLVDSDGNVTMAGRAGFVNANTRLFDDVCELLSTLGFRWSATRAAGTAQRVHWTPRAGEPAAKLAHKRVRQVDADRPLSRFRRIKDIEPVPSVPTRCIGIDTRDHLFLVGRKPVLTHNTQNTMKLFPSLFTPEAIKRFGIQIGRLNVWGLGDTVQIEAITSNYLSVEGGRPTLVGRNETQNWNSSNQGHEMAGAVEGNIAKAERGRARILDVCNAYRPGEDSVGQRARETWETANANSINIGVLYDSLEAPPNAPLTLEAAPAVVKAIAGDSYWLDTEPDGRIVKSIANLSNPPSESRRKWYNQITATADAWVSPQTFDAQAVDEDVAQGERVVLFFDGSKSDDSTALIGCRLSDGFVFTVDVWEKPPHTKTWLVDREDVDRVVSEAHDYWDVRAMWADPSGDARDDDTGERYWDNLIDSWGRRWGDSYDLAAVKTGDNAHPVKWEMRTPSHQKVFVEHAERYVTDVAETNLPHDTDRRLAQHHANARRVPSKFGITLAKEHRESRRKIDAAVCAVGARMMWRIFQATVTTKERTGQAVFFSI